MKILSEIIKPQYLKEQLLSGVAIVALITAAWLALYYLNYSLTFISINNYVSWVFLPATIRLVSVLLFGWLGAIGLFLGALITTIPLADSTSALLLIPAISALGPLLTVWGSLKVLRVERNLHALSGNQLILVALITSFITSLLHSVYFYHTDIPSHFGSMFIGDFIGSLLLLYLAKIIINGLSKSPKFNGKTSD